MCDGRNHNLKVISRFAHSWDDSSRVVRWCADCGSVVVDMDIDGRTNPGYYSKMRTPLDKK